MSRIPANPGQSGAAGIRALQQAMAAHPAWQAQRRSPSTAWTVGRPRHVHPGERVWEPGAARPGGPADVLAWLQSWKAVKPRNRAEIAETKAAVKAAIEEMVPGMEGDLHRLPRVASRRAYRQHLAGMGDDLGREARACQKAPIIIQGEIHGTDAALWTFKDTLAQAKAAGIQRLAIELSRGEYLLYGKLGPIALDLLGEGKVEEFKRVLREDGMDDPEGMSTAGIICFAQYCKEAKAQGFEVSFVDAPLRLFRSIDSRNEHIARRLLKFAEKGEGTLLVTGGLHVAGVYERLKGKAAVRAVTNLSDGQFKPDSALCLRDYVNHGLDADPNFRVLRLHHSLLEGKPAARRMWSSPGRG